MQQLPKGPVQPLPPFVLVLSAMAGNPIERCAQDAIEIADALRVNVEFEFNGIRCIASPGTSADRLVANYRRAIDSPGPVVAAYSRG